MKNGKRTFFAAS